MMPMDDLWLFDLSGQLNGMQVSGRALARGTSPLLARRALRRVLAENQKSELQTKDAGNAFDSALHETQALIQSIQTKGAVIGHLSCVDRRSISTDMHVVRVPKVIPFDRTLAANPPNIPEAAAPWLVDPLPSDDTLPLHLYALFDAGRVPGLLERLEGAGLDMICLFQGNALDRYGDAAPWLVRLAPDHSMTAAFFTDIEDDPLSLGLWVKDAAIFLRSVASLNTLQKHFRKFTMVTDVETGQRVFFRFWAPETLRNVIIHMDSTAQSELAGDTVLMMGPDGEGGLVGLSRVAA